MLKLTYVAGLTVSMLAISVVANAADLPLRPAPPPVAPVPYVAPTPYTWTGWYIGGNLGAGWNQGNVSDTLFGLSFSNQSNNGVFVGGGQVGGNFQFYNNFVVGVEADFDWAANNNNSGTATVAGNTIQLTSTDRWITTVAGRFGYAVDRVLFYGKAGGGWVGNNSFTVTNVTTGTSITGSNNNTNSGWLAGGGIEWAFAPYWSVKAEYDYLGLNNQSVTVPAAVPVLGGDTFSTSNRDVQMFTVGINYLFYGR
jgi:outer membrane immunogenic protein